MKAFLTAVLFLGFVMATPFAGGQLPARQIPKYEWREISAASVEDVQIWATFGRLTFKVEGVEYVFTPLSEGSNYGPSLSAALALLAELRQCEKFQVKFEVTPAKPADRKSISLEDLVVPVGKLK